MAAALTWLDVSAEQQRRVREMIRLFEEPGTRDELGIGAIRDGFSDLLFPGTSTIQTRARYFLFIPWHFQAAQRKGLRGQRLLEHVDRSQRQLIERFRAAGFVEGLIGRQAGPRVKNLPSGIYWNGLGQWGILTAPMSQRAASELAGAHWDDDDAGAHRPSGAWHADIPPAPDGFPSEQSGGFDLTAEEAAWLRERVGAGAEGQLLDHLVGGARLADAVFPWDDPAVAGAPPDAAAALELARRFSLTVHGAALLYNLQVSEIYEARGFTTVESPVAWYQDLLDAWATDVHADASSAWDWDELWRVVADGGHRVPAGAQRFVQAWVEGVGIVGPERVGGDPGLRTLIDARVSGLRGKRAVHLNNRLLGQWQGSSGANQLDYRWNTVRRLVGDIQDGLAHAGT